MLQHSHGRLLAHHLHFFTSRLQGFCPDTELGREMPALVRSLFGLVVPIIMRVTGSPQRPR